MTASEWQHFSVEELTCNCGCGRMEMDERFMKLLVKVRQSFGVPMPVTSGYRCPDYNERVSSTGRDGPHVRGCAVDVSIDRYFAHALIAVALRQGMEGLGVKQKGSGRFLHLDAFTGLQPRPTVWSY